MRTDFTSIGTHAPRVSSNCVTAPTYDKIQSAIRNPPRFEGKPTLVVHKCSFARKSALQPTKPR